MKYNPFTHCSCGERKSKKQKKKQNKQSKQGRRRGAREKEYCANLSVQNQSSNKKNATNAFERVFEQSNPKAATQFCWSKVELTQKIADNAYETIALTISEADCSSAVEEETISHLGIIDYRYMVGEIRFIIPKVMYRVRTLREGRRRCWGFTMICGWKITGKNSSFSFISI